MEPSPDNPLIRFKAFFSGLALFLIFGVLVTLIWMFNRSEPTTPEDMVAETRRAARAAVDEAQSANLPPEAIDAAISGLAEKLTTATPVAVERPEQLIPSSATALRLAEEAEAGGGDDVIAKINEMTLPAGTPIDPEIMAKGQAAFIMCAACHGQNGEGGPAGPPLAESEWVTGPVSNLVRIQLRGLMGPITVKGQEYNMVMAPMAYQDDETIAAVLTYVRNSFGNEAPPVVPAQVEALRGEVGLPMLTVDDLIDPN
jgi:mono/diheme cytochrome c family protein